MELIWAKESRKEWFQIGHFKICIEFELLLNCSCKIVKVLKVK